MRPHGTQKELERRRRQAIQLLDQKIRPVDIARKLGCSTVSVHRWNQARRIQGQKGLDSKHVPGRPLKLNERQKQSLAKVLLKGALKSGYSTELWTLPRIAQVIGKRFEVFYHPGHVWRVLHSMGWSCQKPEKQARERDEEKVRRWKRHTWPHIKKV